MKAAITADPHGHPVHGSAVDVRVSPEGRASFGGVLRCGSVWCCPVCASRIALERGAELEHVLREHFHAGGGALLVTLTVRHELRHDLRELRRAVSGELRRIRQDRGWREWKLELEHRGDIRALEVTTGPRAGWHPHIHLLYLTAAPVAPARAAELEAWLFAVWSRRLEAAGLPRPERWAVEDGSRKGLGVNVEVCRSDQVGRYLAKLGLTGEITGGSSKRGRAGNRTPFQVLADAAATGNAADVAIWRRWASGSKGARQLTWSKGLRAAFGLAPEELTDAELAALDERDGDICARIPAVQFELYAPVPGWLCKTLELAEEGGGLAVLEWMRWCNERFRGRAPPAGWAAILEGLHYG